MEASNSPARTGGQILVDALVAQGVDHVFCVPGESYLAALDAFHDAPLEITAAVSPDFRARYVTSLDALPGSLTGVGWSDHWSFWEDWRS